MSKKKIISYILENFASMGASRFQLKKEEILMKLFDSRINHNLSYFMNEDKNLLGEGEIE